MNESDFCPLCYQALPQNIPVRAFLDDFYSSCTTTFEDIIDAKSVRQSFVQSDNYFQEADE